MPSQDELPIAGEGVVDAPPGSPPPTPEPPAPSTGKPRPKGGRRSAAEEVDDYLRKHGLVTVPAGHSPGASPVPDAGAVVVPEPFDEAGTRLGVAGLVNGADSVAQWQFERRAREILKDDAAAKKFGAAAAMPEATRRVIVDSAVEVCRKYGVSIGPEAGLVGALAQWGYQLRTLFRDLEALKDTQGARST